MPSKKPRPPRYNEQIDNPTWGGKLPGWVQCFATSCVMFLDAFLSIPRVRYLNFERDYIDSVESHVGQAGIAERVMAKIPTIRNMVRGGMRSGAFWLVHKAACQELLKRENFPGEVVFRDGGPISELTQALDSGPVVVGTKFTHQGHIILVLRYDRIAREFVCHDPWGRWTPDGYVRGEGAGECVRYAYDDFVKYCCEMVFGDTKKARFMYLRR